MVSSSAQKWRDNRSPPLLFNRPRPNRLVAWNVGCPLNLKLSIVGCADLSYFPQGVTLSVLYHVISEPGPRNDQSPEANLLAYILTILCTCRTDLFVVRICPSDVVEHRHEDNSSLKVFVTAFQGIHEFLDLVDDLQWCVSWVHSPLELHWIAVDSIQFSASMCPSEPRNPIFQLNVGIWHSFIFPTHSTESENT